MKNRVFAEHCSSLSRAHIIQVISIEKVDSIGKVQRSPNTGGLKKYRDRTKTALTAYLRLTITDAQPAPPYIP
ncbi:MAG: hypothetical protein NVS9B4_08330 [Candidatus Acidiferrum sp.]